MVKPLGIVVKRRLLDRVRVLARIGKWYDICIHVFFFSLLVSIIFVL